MRPGLRLVRDGEPERADRPKRVDLLDDPGLERVLTEIDCGDCAWRASPARCTACPQKPLPR